MHYMFRPHRAIFRQHIIKESTALCTLPIVILQYVVIVINFSVIGCLFFLSFVRRALCAPLGVPLLVLCVMCWFMFLVQTSHDSKINNNNDVLLECYWQSAQCSGFLNNVLPEDGPVWPKYVAHKLMVCIVCILVWLSFKSTLILLHYRRKRITNNHFAIYGICATVR
jgi:hypothetical protein